MRLAINTFKGMVPLIEASKLPNEHATKAVNCRFDSGSLEPYGQLNNVSANIVTGATSIFLYADQYWFSWIDDVDAVNSPINEDVYDRVYFTGNGVPKMTANTVATGSGVMPVVSYKMGVKQPIAPVIVGYQNNTQNDEGPEDDITRFYVTTYVTEFGEEGMPSLISDEVTLLDPSASVDLSFAPVGLNEQNITRRRLYRTAGNDYQLVADMPVGTLAYNDSKTDTELGIILDTWLFSEPIADMQGLTAMANGILAGFSGNTICFSEAFLPHAWPVDYQQTTTEDIVAVKSVGNSLVVGTKGRPYLFSGVSPDAISGVQLEISQACVSKRSMVDMGRYVIYASPDGLVAVGENTAEILTASLFNKKTWSNYQPETINAAFYEDKYVAFYGNSGGFIFDPRTRDFIELDFHRRALHSELLTDTLYLSDGSVLQEFDESSNELQYEWGKTIRLNQAASPSCAYIDTDEPHKVGLTVSVDGVELLNYSDLSSGDINQGSGLSPLIRLPAQRGREFTLTVTGTGKVHQLAVASNMKSARNA